MEEKYQLKEGCLTIQMPKELDHHEAGRLKMEADFLIGAYHVRRLVFDFRETEFISNASLIVSTNTILATDGSNLVKSTEMISRSAPPSAWKTVL